ncbi:MAG: BrnA antitoxin family protein [Candidatus Omnitrophica bacterium]|nr:BrnA antitoxin family protein [Candidatus Omnitrophota bacterium]
MPKRYKEVPRFKTEDEERAFWATHDLTDFVDPKSARRVHFPNLKPTLRTISIRLPEFLIWELKELANERDVPYQALLKNLLAERVEEELRKRRRAA